MSSMAVESESASESASEGRGELQGWLQRFDALVAELDVLSFAGVRRACERGQAKLAAVEARRLAAESNGDTKRARRLAAADRSRSRRSARAAAGRARAVRENAGLACAMSDGRLSVEKLDTIVGAMSTDASAAHDAVLIGAVGAASVDQGRRIAADWITRRRDRDQVQEEYERQRRHRRAYRYDNRKSGLSALTLEGDDTTIDELWNLISGRERALFAADGGRDVPVGEHVRSRDQRSFDAAVELIKGRMQPGLQGVESVVQRSVAGGLGAGGSVVGGSAVRDSIVGGAALGRGRPSIVITVPVGAAPTAVGPRGPRVMADEELRARLRQADISVVLVDATSARPLAWGRVRRRHSVDQFFALVVRDQGCVRCDGHWLHCEVHHVIPWHAPAAGQTDLDNLALVCSTCHHDLHDQHLTLVQDRTGRWTTRAATAAELAPKRPSRATSTAPQKGVHRSKTAHRVTGTVLRHTPNKAREGDHVRPSNSQRHGH